MAERVFGPITTANDIYSVAIPIVLVLIAFEAIFSARKNLGYYKNGDTLGSLGLIIGNIAVKLLTQASVFGFQLWLFSYKIIDVSALMPIWAQAILVAIAIDLVFYWYHRASHRVRFLWAIHMNHHSSEEMNFVVAFRQAWFGPLSKVPFFAVLPLVGFDPTLIVVVGVFNTLWGVWGHTRIIGKLGPLEGIMNTPSAHRVHHGSNPEYIDKNYGNLFMIWDRMFGTYQAEKAPVVYGITDNVKTNNPVTITLLYWRTILRDIGKAQGLKDKIRCFTAPPDWQP